MSTSHSVIGVFLTSVVLFNPEIARTEEYPNKPIRILTQSVGGGPDVAARLIAHAITSALGQQVVVENRTASSTAPGEGTAKAPPDGYTLLVHAGSLWLTPFLRDNVPYDPVRDFSPITLLATSPSFVVVHPSLPVKSVAQLIALAKARPGQLNFGTGITGGQDHLAAELFKVMTGVDMVRIPYKGGAVLMNDVISGQVQLSFPSGGTAVAHIKSGRLRALAVTSAKRCSAVSGLAHRCSNRTGLRSDSDAGNMGAGKYADSDHR